MATSVITHTQTPTMPGSYIGRYVNGDGTWFAVVVYSLAGVLVASVGPVLDIALNTIVFRERLIIE